jgi:hypothetical protein
VRLDPEKDDYKQTADELELLFYEQIQKSSEDCHAAAAAQSQG